MTKKTDLGLFDAIKAYQKNPHRALKSFINLVEEQLDRDIDDAEYQLKTASADLKEKLSEKEEVKMDRLLTIDNSKLNDRDNRKDYAIEYLRDAAKAIGTFKTEVSMLERNVEVCKDDVANLKSLKKDLSHFDLTNLIEED